MQKAFLDHRPYRNRWQAGDLTDLSLPPPTLPESKCFCSLCISCSFFPVAFLIYAVSPSWNSLHSLSIPPSTFIRLTAKNPLRSAYFSLSQPFLDMLPSIKISSLVSIITGEELLMIFSHYIRIFCLCIFFPNRLYN